jgi:amino acid transporter
MMSYFSGVLDNAVYPVLMIQYITESAIFDDISPDARWISIVIFTIMMTTLTWRGLDVNGMTCIALTAFVLLPFLVFTILGIPQIEPSNWLLGPFKRDASGHVMEDDEVMAKHDGGFESVKWHSLVNILFWNLNYFDSASAFSGDCVEPAKTFPKGERMSL